MIHQWKVMSFASTECEGLTTYILVEFVFYTQLNMSS